MQNISLYGTIASRYHHLRTLRTIIMMNAISHQIERQILHHQMPVDFYAGFQRFSYFLPQQAVYTRLGALCHKIYLFGIADITPPSIPGVEFVALSSDMHLAKEWFLLVDSAEFWTLLSTQERDELDPEGERQFDGIWTFDAPVLESASQLLMSALGQTYTPLYERYASLQSQNVAEVTEGLLLRQEKKAAQSSSNGSHDVQQQNGFKEKWQ